MKSIGWVCVDSYNEPVRPVLGTGWRKRRKPVTVYQTKNIALSQGSNVKEVFIETD